MLDAIREEECIIEPGTVLDSTVHFKIFGNDLLENCDVGDKITIPEHLTKIVTREKINDVPIERYFLRLGTHDIAPIYLKIYDDSTDVLVLTEGINHAREMLKGSNIVTRFTRHKLLDMILGEMYYYDPYQIVDIKDYYDLCARDDLDNDSIALGHNSWLVGVEHRPRTIQTASYDVTFIPVESLDLQRHAKYLSDLSVVVNLYGNPDEFNPLFNELYEFSRPHTGSRYGEFSFDDATELTAREGMLTSRDIGKYIGNVPRGQLYSMLPNPAVKCYNEYKPIINFSPALMTWLLYLHNLPAVELGFKFILSKRIPIDCFLYQSIDGENDPSKLKPDEINMLTRLIPEAFPGCSRVEVLKDALDNLYLVTVDMRGKELNRWKIDLTIATLLTQCLARK